MSIIWQIWRQEKIEAEIKQRQKEIEAKAKQEKIEIEIKQRWKKIKAKAKKKGHKWICGWGCGYSAPDEKSGTYIAAPGYDDYPRCNNCGGN